MAKKAKKPRGQRKLPRSRPRKPTPSRKRKPAKTNKPRKRRKRRKHKKHGEAAYKLHAARANERQLRKSIIGRDIQPGYTKEKSNKERVESCRLDFQLFCTTYFPAWFNLPWCDDQIMSAKGMQAVALRGGQQAIAEPRGQGKTVRCICLVIWAVLYGHRRFTVLIGATSPLASKVLKIIKEVFASNELLLADFPHVCWPIKKLCNDGRKAGGQLFGGDQTNIGWGKTQLILPTMPKSAIPDHCTDVSSAIISVHGITGAIRGLNHQTPDGRIVRPDLVIPDDPQDRESATSTLQSKERAEIIQGDVLGLAGPDANIAAVMPCTVIQEGDLADTFLDRKRHPAWRGIRTKAVYAWPKNDALWEQYFKIREEGLLEGDEGTAATEFYKQNQAAMDEGAIVAWPARFGPSEISGIQCMMNLRRDRGEVAFMAEYNNDPVRPGELAVPVMSAAQLARKVYGLERGLIPTAALYLTAFIDVQDNLLYWAVAAWANNFTGWVIDYGTYPEQPIRQFTLARATRTMPMLVPGAGPEAAIRAGLDTFTVDLLSRPWRRADGGTMKVQRCLIDSGYQKGIVYDVVRRSVFSAIVLPSQGRGFTANMRQMSEWKPLPGEIRGPGWVIGKDVQENMQRIAFNSNYWKSCLHARLSTHVGDPGCIALYGNEAKEHEQIGEHLSSELPKRATAGGFTVDEWYVKPGARDNHWLDCCVGNCVAASVLGAVLPGQSKIEAPKPVSWAAQYRAAKGRRVG